MMHKNIQLILLTSLITTAVSPMDNKRKSASDGSTQQLKKHKADGSDALTSRDGKYSIGKEVDSTPAEDLFTAIPVRELNRIVLGYLDQWELAQVIIPNDFEKKSPDNLFVTFTARTTDDQEIPDCMRLLQLKNNVYEHVAMMHENRNILDGLFSAANMYVASNDIVNTIVKPESTIQHAGYGQLHPNEQLIIDRINSQKYKNGSEFTNSACSHLLDCNRHNQRNLPQKPHKCRLCEVSFSNFHYLNQHENTAHPQIVCWCAECYKPFSTSKLLTDHYKLHQTLVIWKIGTDQKYQLHKKINYHTKAISALAFSPDNKYIASADTNIRLTQIESDKHTIIEGNGDRIKSILYLGSGSSIAALIDNNVVQIWRNQAHELEYT